MKQYLLSVHGVEGAPLPAEEEMNAAFAAVATFNEEVMASGAWVFAGGLFPPSTATTVKVVDGDIVTTDGPFAETKEQLGGFWVIKAENLDGALDWARKATVACKNPVEVRPFQDEPES